MQKDISRHKPTFAVITMVFLLTNSLANGTRQMRVIPGPKGLPYSDGIVVGKTLYIAGQQGRDEHDHLKAGGIGPETQAALEDLASVVKAAGFDLKDVVSVTVYLVDIRELDDSNKVYRDFMPDPKPARTVVQVGGLVDNARIEISAIAVKQ